MYTTDTNIFNNIENLYNMNGQSWREVLAILYQNFGNIENAFSELETKFGISLPKEVQLRIENMVKDGTLGNLINDDLLVTINKKVENVKEELPNKLDKNGIVTMANMGQDVKEAMTGGSVAVVGENAVTNVNIVDGQVYGEKTNFLNQINLNLFKGKFYNYYLTGAVDAMGLTKDTNGKVIILDIKPNTKYSINKKQVGIDGDMFYFKIATFTKNSESLISTLEQTNTVMVDGAISVNLSQNNIEYTNHTFTTGASDKSLVVLVGKTKTPYTEICEGEYFSLLYDNYNGIYEFKKNVNIEGDNILDKSLDVNKLSFLEIVNKNLFDGKFLPFYVAGPNDGVFLLTKSDLYKTLIVDVKPNTTYTLLKDPTSSEGGYFYTKIASFLLPKNQLIRTDNYVQDGSVGIAITSKDTTYLTFTTGEKDKSVAITVAKSQTPYVEVLEGNFTSFQDNSYERVFYYKNFDYYTKKEIDAKIENVQVNRISKRGNVFNISMNGKIKYVLEKHIDSNINLDTYMLTSGSYLNTVIWSGSDIEAPIKEKGANDFIGGVHGDEKFESVTILCDGNVLDLNSDYDKEFKTLIVFVKSTLFRCETTTPAFTRYKKLEFKDGELIVSNRLVTLLDNFVVERYTGSGLYSVYKDLLNGYTINTIPELITEGSQQKSKDIVEGTFFGKGYTVTLKALEGMGDKYKGSVTDFYNENRPRFKFYFDTINGDTTFNTNDELQGSFSIKIN